MRTFAAERAEREVLTSGKTVRQPQAAGDHKSNGDVNPQSLAAVLSPLLSANGFNEGLPGIDTSEDFPLERKCPATALPQPGGKVRMERVGGVPRPPLP